MFVDRSDDLWIVTHDMVVSWNRGTSKSSILVGFPIVHQPFLIPPFMEPPI